MKRFRIVVVVGVFACLAPQARSQDLAGVLQDAGNAAFCCEVTFRSYSPVYGVYGDSRCFSDVDPLECLNVHGGAPGTGPCNKETGKCAFALPFCCEYVGQGGYGCDNSPPILGRNCTLNGGTSSKMGTCDPDTARCVSPVPSAPSIP